MKKLIILITIILLLQSCTNPFSGKPKEPEKKPDIATIKANIQRKENQKEIEAKINNPKYYVGEYTLKIEDIQKSRQDARDNALNDLATKIEVKVKIDVEKTLSNISTMSATGYSDKDIEIINQKSQIYAEHVISNYREKYYQDYPQKNYITCLVWVEVNDYEEKVKKDLNKKKQMIRETIISSNNNFIAENYMAAVHNLISAKKFMNLLFDGLPLQIDIDGDGSEEEVTAYLNGRITNIFDRIQLVIDENENFTFDVSGNLNNMPMIYTNYIDDNNQKHPFAKLPLKANYIEGKGKLSAGMMTGDYGQIELPIRDLDAKNSI
ncbi:MAG: hypothetical protein U9N34_11210, partial [Candidatus Cloacimonadota bacterium]|nr:hypothetical protein [Candidatus Cloacimonadota bacterium]